MIFASKYERALEALKQAYPEPKIGDRYTYEEVKKLTELEKESELRHIFNRFSKRLKRERNLQILTERGFGWFVANAEQRLDHALKRQEKAYNQTKKAVEVITTTNRDDLPKEQQRVYDHALLSASRHAQAYQEDKRALKMLPPKSVSKD
jgi:hypothetical protein